MGAGSVRQASQHLAGDLDAIVLAALRKEPARRYGSADALARDIHAYLDGMPVTARPDGVGYRLGKFVRRRRIELAAGGIAVAALVGGIVVSRARAQEAERERLRAEEITDFLTNMLIAANPSELGREVTMREVMDSAAVRADSLRDRPALEIEIRNVIAGTYLGLGSYDEALAEYQKALDAARRSEPVAGRRTAMAMSQLSTGHEYIGDYGTADSLFGLAQQLMDRVGYRDKGEEREWLEHRGRLLGRLGNFADAIPLLQRALTIHLEIEPENDSASAYFYNNLAVAVGEVGDQAGADTLFRTALDLERKAVGERHPLYASSLSAYSTVLERLGRLEAADTAMRKVLDIRRQLLGEDHPDYAWTMFNYADFLVKLERHAEAAEWSRKVLALRGRTLDDAHPAISTAMQVLGRAMAGLDSLDQAERLMRESLALRREHFPPGHWAIASSVSHLGVVIGQAGRYAEAERLLLESEAELLEKRGEMAQPVRDARQRLVDLYHAWGRPQQAAAWQEKLDAPEP
jgi:serine/threonine-protein kinase